MSQTKTDVAIVGMACRFADAESPEDLWSNLVEKRASFRPFPSDRWDHETFWSERFRENDKTYVTTGAFIDDVDSFPALWFGIAPRRVEVMDPQHRLVLETTRRALEDAGLGRGFDGERVGTFLGVSTSEYRNLVTSRSMALMMAGGAMGDASGAGEALSQAVENVAPISAFSMPGTLLNMTAANVANHWKLGGPAYTVDAACASSLVAVADAVTHIRAGVIDSAIAGGVYVNLTPETIVGFSRIGAISQKGACRPFDADADGFLQGEGCGVVILKRLDLALAEGDRIYGVIRGAGVNNDAGSSSGPMAPSLDGQIAAVRKAYEDSGIDPATVGFVSCHGTATPVGDPVEVGALRAVMGAEGGLQVYLGSVKANIGHTMSAAGVAGLIQAVLALQHGEVPPQAGYDAPHPALGIEEGRFRVPTERVRWERNGAPRRAGVSAFGFGGTNVHLVVEEAPAEEAVVTDDAVQTVVLSAGTRELLARHADRMADAIEAGGFTLEQVAYTLSAARRAENARIAVAAGSIDELASELRKAAQRLEQPSEPSPVLSPNSFYGAGKEAAKLAWMFPGQGAQRVGLFRDLDLRYPTFSRYLEEAGAPVRDVLGKSVRELLYPESTDAASEQALTATEVCQPVMAAVGLALARFLADLGIRPDAVLGHSLGEFVAAGAAGLIRPDDAVRFVAVRGQLMAKLDIEDPGAMAAVMATPQVVEAALVDGAVVANVNHPQQTVISGATKSVDAACAELEAGGHKVTRLRVSHAFHSPVVAPMVDALADEVAKLDLSEPAMPVISAITGAEYSAADAAETFVAHTTSRVDFVAALERCRDLGVDAFLEVGAGSTLTAFAQGTLGREVAARSLGAREDDGGREFHRALAMLVAAGLDVDFGPLFERRAVVSLPSTPLETSRHWVIRDKKVPLDVPEASKRGETVGNPQDGNRPESDQNALVALFREQNEILRQHAAIMAAQNAVLSGGSVSVPTVAVPEPVAPTAILVDEPAEAQETSSIDVVDATAAAAAEPSYAAVVFESVAGVSAFPADALSREQELAGDLGFDSLMFVDLASELQRRIVGLAIPQDALGPRATIGDLVDFVDRTQTKTAREEAPTEAVEDRPLRRAVVEWSAVEPSPLRGLRFAPAGKVLVTTLGADTEAMAFARALEARGVATRLVDLDDGLEVDGGVTAVVHFGHRAVGWSPEHVVVLRQLAAELWRSSANAPEAFVVVGSAEGAAAMRGALRGFAKALSREWPEARVLSVQADADVAARVLSELDEPAGYAEVRWADGLREVPVPLPADDEIVELALGADDVVAITGGARGIGALCARALAEKTEAKLILIGSSEPTAAKELLTELGDRATYVQWDVREPQNLEVQPTVVVHAAGVIRDAKVHDKTDEDVRLVTSVKVDGLLNVLEAAGEKVRLVVGFGSWAGRFGNASQTDYAAANDAVTEHLRELASTGVRAVNIDWPIWEDSAMAETIPASLREMMRNQGVTFISPEEGVEAFMAELGRVSTGEVFFGREVPRREAPYRAHVDGSLETLPYVADHVVRGLPIVPFAGGLDWLATAARLANDSLDPLVLRDVQVFKPLDLSSPVAIDVRADLTRGHGVAEVLADGELSFRAKVAFEPSELAVPEREGDAVTPKLDLATFYERHSFHGPRIRGIAKVDGIAPTWIVGRVKTSSPAQLLESDTTSHWTIDPLVIDGAMQLVLYHLRSLHGFGAIPTSIDKFVQVRPFSGPEVKCSMVLDEMADGQIVGTIAFEDEDGLAAVMYRLRAREFHDAASAANDEPAPVAKEFWDIAEFPEVKELEQRLQMADLIGIRNPYFWPHTGPARNVATIEGREMINFSSYNYCGFSGHPEVSKAAQDAVAAYGTSVSASRLASGQIPLHQELEDEIASFIGTEAALAFSAGHMTNETCIGHLFGKNDLIIHDSLAHNSILTGAELSGAKRMQFPHSDYEALDRILRKIRSNYQKVGIFIEGVYSMDGDIPDLPKFVDVKRRHRCLLYVDEAHSIGVIGPRGAGISDYFGIDPRTIDVWMGTLSKSFASCGGYIAGSSKLIQYLKYTAPAFVFSAGISPANAGAALASVKLLKANPEIPQTLQKRADLFLRLCKEAGLDTGMSRDSAVVPCIVGNSLDCLKLSQRLAERGVNVQPIVYPAVEDESSRLRFFLSATHTEDELGKTVEILSEELRNVRSGAAAE